jgi:hypothetical protein
MDDALIRRFALREFPPSVSALQTHLASKAVSSHLIGRLSHAFSIINDRLPHGFGHSHFWNIRTEDDFRDLWASRIQFILKRAFLFDETSFTALKAEIDEIFPLPTPTPTDPELGPPDPQATNQPLGANEQ